MVEHRRGEAMFETDKAANGLELLEGTAGLIDAWAVLADTDAIAGPVKKMDLGGGSNNDPCADGSVRGGDGTWPADTARC